MTETRDFTIDSNYLREYSLVERLGEGADLQTFLATDNDTGEQIVIKRPHPSLISRRLHDDVERRMLLQARLRTELGGIGCIPRLYGLTEPDHFEWFFGDDLECAYHVLLEERAVGIPLVGSVGDQVRGHPVGLPINLFVFHAPAQITPSPALEVLHLIGSCFDRGYLALDLGPRNVFYSPGNATTTVIDLGDLRSPEPGSRRREPLDVNDMVFEFFALYTTPLPTPDNAADFMHIREPRAVGTIARRARALSEEYARIVDVHTREVAIAILHRIGERGYDSVSGFADDFEDYLEQTRNEMSDDSFTGGPWEEAIRQLYAPYWSKYVFDAEDELARFV